MGCRLRVASWEFRVSGPPPEFSYIRTMPLNCKAASLIEKETLEKRISNNEYLVVAKY